MQILSLSRELTTTLSSFPSTLLLAAGSPIDQDQENPVVQNNQMGTP